MNRLKWTTGAFAADPGLPGDVWTMPGSWLFFGIFEGSTGLKLLSDVKSFPIAKGIYWEGATLLIFVIARYCCQSTFPRSFLTSLGSNSTLLPSVFFASS